MTTRERRPSGELAGFSPLHYACASKKLDEVVKFLELGGDPNIRDIYGETGLHLAIQNNSVEIVQALLQRKASVNCQNDSGNSPLHVAAQHGFEDIVKILVEAGADPSIRNHKSHLPLDLCKKEGVRKLLEGAVSRPSCEIEHHEDDFALLTFACVRSDTKGVEDLLTRKPSLLNTKSVYGDTIFHLVCETGHVKMVRLLLDLKADPSTKNARGMTGFEEAKAAGFGTLAEEVEDTCQCIDAIKEYGSDTGLAYTDLQYACVRNDLLEVRRILSTTPDSIDTVNVYGDTALHYAARSGSIGIVNFLLEHKASVNLKSVSSGETPLIFAVRRGNREIIEKLISVGADAEIRNKKGKSANDLLKEKGMIIGTGSDEKSSFSPLMYACVKGDIEKVKNLISKNSSTVQEVNVYGDSCLSYACMGRSVEMVKVLIDSKSDVNITNNFGDTPLHMAVGNPNREAAVGIVKLLTSAGADKTLKNHKNKIPKELSKHDTVTSLLS
jgi:ankyrin repeat protein